MLAPPPRPPHNGAARAAGLAARRGPISAAPAHAIASAHPTPRRRWLRLLWPFCVGVLCGALCTLGAGFYAHSRVTRALAEAESRLGVPVAAEAVHVAGDRIVLTGIQFGGTGAAAEGLRIEQVQLFFDLLAPLTGEPLLTHALVDRPRARLIVAGRAADAPDALLVRLRARLGGSAAAGADAPPVTRRLPTLATVPFTLQGGELTLVDPQGAVLLVAADIHGDMAPDALRGDVEALFQAQLSGPDWRVDGALAAALDRVGGGFRAGVRFAHPLPVPAASYAGLPLESLAVGGLFFSSKGTWRIHDVRLSVAAEPGVPAALRGARAFVAETEALARPDGFGWSKAQLLEALTAGPLQLRRVSLQVPALGARVRVAAAELHFAAGPAGRPALRELRLVRPRATLPAGPVEATATPLIAALRQAPVPPGATHGEAALESAAHTLLGPWLQRLGDLTLDIHDGRVVVRALTALGGQDLTLDGLAATLAPPDAAGVRRLKFAAARLDDGRAVDEASLQVLLGANGEPLEVRVGGRSESLPAALPHFVPHAQAKAGAELRGDLTLTGLTSQNPVRAQGTLVVSGLVFEHPWVAAAPVGPLGLDADVDVQFDRAADRFSVFASRLSFGHAHVELALDVQRARSRPLVEARLTLPRQPCSGLAADVPRALVPRLTDLRLSGSAAFEIWARYDPADPTQADVDVRGDIDDCQIDALGPGFDVHRLNGRFVQQVVEGGVATDIQVGPGTRDYVALRHIPTYVQQAALATEDMAFFSHQGFRLSLMRRALRLNLENGRYVYGGSTISQQLVKNLFLSREKTLSRKIEEALIVFQMERLVPKERILELYLNCIEYGPGIYGLRRAAQHYFGKEPRDLTPLEGAFLMGLKPSPKSGFHEHKLRRFRRWWQEKMERILRRLWQEMGVLTHREYVQAAPYVPTFYYADEPPESRYLTPRATVELTPLAEDGTAAEGPPPTRPNDFE